MKKGILISIAILGILLLNNCKEDEKNDFSGIITGELYDACYGKPLEGELLEIWKPGRADKWYRQGTDRKSRGTTTTDKDGKFTFTIDESFGGNRAYINLNRADLGAQLIIHGNIGVYSDKVKVDIGKLYIKPLVRKVNFTFKKKKKNWTAGQYVVVYPQNDTFSLKNGHAVGRSLYVKGTIQYPTNFLEDTASMGGNTTFEWSFKKKKERVKNFYRSSPCDTSHLGTMLFSE